MKLIDLQTISTEKIVKDFALPDDEATKTRIESIEKFQSLGLPNRKSEIFSKTGIKSIYEKEYLQDRISDNFTALPQSDNFRIVFRKGVYSPLQSKLPEGITVGFDKTPVLNNLSTNPFYYLSGALNQNFYCIHVAKGFEVETPLEILYIDAVLNSQTHMHITLEVAERASINLFERVLIDTSSFFNHTLNVILNKDSKIVHVHQQSAQDTTHIINNYNYIQHENSSAKIYSYQDGSELAIALWDIDLVGEHADVDFTALQLPTQMQKLNTIINLKHNAPNTTSNQLIKQIIDDEAKGLVDAKVIVSKNGAGTKAKQLCNSLLLSDKASAQAYIKPQLEIFIDDLEASHGATVGSLSEEQLYYLMSRGISEDNARLLLIEAFKKAAYERFPSWAKEQIDEQQSIS